MEGGTVFQAGIKAVQASERLYALVYPLKTAMEMAERVRELDPRLELEVRAIEAAVEVAAESVHSAMKVADALLDVDVPD